MDCFNKFDISDETSNIIVNDTILNNSTEESIVRPSNLQILQEMEFTAMSPALVNRRENINVVNNSDNIFKELIHTVLTKIDDLETQNEKLHAEIDYLKKEINIYSE